MHTGIIVLCTAWLIFDRNMVQFDVDERPGAEEREHAGEREGAGQHVAQHPLVAEQRTEVAQRSAQVEPLSPLFRQRLLDEQGHETRPA